MNKPKESSWSQATTTSWMTQLFRLIDYNSVIKYECINSASSHRLWCRIIAYTITWLAKPISVEQRSNIQRNHYQPLSWNASKHTSQWSLLLSDLNLFTQQKMDYFQEINQSCLYPGSLEVKQFGKYAIMRQSIFTNSLDRYILLFFVL